MATISYYFDITKVLVYQATDDRYNIYCIVGKTRGGARGTLTLPDSKLVTPKIQQQWFTDLFILNIERKVANSIKTESVLDKYSTKTRKIVLK